MATDPVRTASMEPALSGAHLLVREMELSEVGIRIDCFHDATDEHLRTLGVDRALLPSRTAWRRFYETDYARPVFERENYSLVWHRTGRCSERDSGTCSPGRWRRARSTSTSPSRAGS